MPVKLTHKMQGKLHPDLQRSSSPQLWKFWSLGQSCRTFNTDAPGNFSLYEFPVDQATHFSGLSNYLLFPNWFS